MFRLVVHVARVLSVNDVFVFSMIFAEMTDERTMLFFSDSKARVSMLIKWKRQARNASGITPEIALADVGIKQKRIGAQ